MSKKTAEKAAKGKPAGWIEVIDFDPEMGAGRVAVCSRDALGNILDVTHEFFEAGGVIMWDDDLRSLPLIDRYTKVRKSIVARCPSGYPIPDVMIAGKSVSKSRIRRLQRDAAEKLAEYLETHGDAVKKASESFVPGTEIAL